MSDSIITIDIGGQIFRTTLSTLTKYPGSLLGTMFSHLDSGLGVFPCQIFVLFLQIVFWN